MLEPKLKLRCRSTSLYMRPEKTLGHVFQISISVLYSEPFHRPFQELCTAFTLMQKVTVWSVAYGNAKHIRLHDEWEKVWSTARLLH